MSESMSDVSSNGRITWTQDGISEVPLQRFTGRVGAIEVATVEFDGSNRLWTWWSPLSDDIWGHAKDADGAKQAADVWLREWLENFRTFFEAGRRRDHAAAGAVSRVRHM
ncbi:hypothetical protein GCM10008965_24520 [Methylorubrum aminovorans]|nr:hypothetical protein GCM10025880_28900 [Methylorubrum aminovorans]